MMKTTTAILAVIGASTLSVLAGPSAMPVQTGKGPVVCPAPLPAPARCTSPISYNNVELLYAHTNLDGTSEDADGGIFRAEWSPMEHFYVTGGAQYHELADIEMWAFTAGVGGYMPLTQNIHFVMEAGGIWASLDVPGYEDSPSPEPEPEPSPNSRGRYKDEEFGWYARPHIRAKFGCLEVHTGATYTSIDGINGADWDEWAGFASLYYELTPNWDLTAGVTYSSDRTTLTGGARYRF